MRPAMTAAATARPRVIAGLFAATYPDRCRAVVMFETWVSGRLDVSENYASDVEVDVASVMDGAHIGREARSRIPSPMATS